MKSNRDLFISSFLRHIAETMLQHTDEQRKLNYAFEVFSIAAMLDKPFEEVLSDIRINGTNDGGFDGLYYQKQTDDTYIFHVFQCKTSATLKQNEIVQFQDHYQEIFEKGNQLNLDNISDITQWIDEYKDLSSKGFIITPRLYFLFNGLKNDPDTNNFQIYNNFNQPDQNFFIYDAEDIFHKIIQEKSTERKEHRFTFFPESSNISLRHPHSLYTYSILNIKAANFRVKAYDLCKLVEEEISINGSEEFLFEENLRFYLGYRARANQRMKETLDDSNKAIYFPFLNNGITMICDEMKIPDAPQDGKYILPVRNPQIVNGLQTTMVLYETFKKNQNSLDQVFVNLRIYETNDNEIIECITDATNTQTPITYRDKLSNKQFLEILTRLFEVHNIELITKRGQVFSPHHKMKNLINVNIDTVIKYWYATWYERPEIAKDSISRVLQDINEAARFRVHPLYPLFNGDKDSPIYAQMLDAFKIYQKIRSNKEENKEMQFIVYADELIAYGVHMEQYFNKLSVSESYTKVVNLLNQIIQFETTIYQEKGKVFNMSGFFKNQRCRDELNEKMGMLETVPIFEKILK